MTEPNILDPVDQAVAAADRQLLDALRIAHDADAGLAAVKAAAPHRDVDTAHAAADRQLLDALRIAHDADAGLAAVKAAAALRGPASVPPHAATAKPDAGLIGMAGTGPAAKPPAARDADIYQSLSPSPLTPPREAQPGFTVTVSQNKYLHAGESELHALLWIAGTGLAPGSAADVAPAEVVMVDCSGSMAVPPTKIVAARRAAVAAIDCLRDGVFFAVVECTERARMVYPPEPRLVPASPETRAAAKNAASRLVAGGGTAIGAWLAMAARLLDRHPAAVRHAILLTDGKYEHGRPEYLDRVLAACAGTFRCDLRGIGDDWEPEELLRIASVLHGTADAVRDPAELEQDFRAMMEAAMRNAAANVGLRLKTRSDTRLRHVRQVFPTESDLSVHRVDVDPTTAEFAIGAWADQEEREYLVCIEVDRASMPSDEDALVARVDLFIQHAGEVRTAPGAKPTAIVAHRIDREGPGTYLNQGVRHYLEQAELGRAARAGCEAYAAGDIQRAEAELGRAVKRATESGSAGPLKLLERLVDILDAANGRVQMKDDVDIADLLISQLRSVRTSPGPQAEFADLPNDAREQGLVLGLEGERLQPVVHDSRNDTGLIVIGDAQCGKTSALRVVGRQVVERWQPRQAKVILFDYRRTMLGDFEDESVLGSAATPSQAAGLVAGLVVGFTKRLPGAEVTPQQLRDRNWWTGPDVYVLVDDYDLVAAGSNPLLPLLPFLSQARDVGLHLFVALRADGASRALLDPFLGAMRELGFPAVVLSSPRDESPMFGVRPGPLPPGRGTLVHRRYGTVPVQLAPPELARGRTWPSTADDQ